MSDEQWTIGEPGDTIPEGVKMYATFWGPNRPSRTVQIGALPYVAEPEEGERGFSWSVEFTPEEGEESAALFVDE
jgi:hypothetical protein